jgi:serine/threonine-protein kinase
MIGAVLGRTYRITRVLGEGGMARLYEAEHLRIDARFAVKVIHHELAVHTDQLARFEREARAATRIRSEHVVRLLDVLVTEDARPCLVTELLEGEDLQVRLDRVKKISVSDAIPIALQICRGIADAHAAGVVHRDLKPSNVFLCRQEGAPFVKIVDFGIAKLDDDDRLTKTGAIMGTAAYMAPEQARRAVDAGPLADVYSIGAVMYHMLTAEPPYGNIPPVSRFALLLNEEPARPRSRESSIPEGFEAVIQHAMARDPKARFQNAGELLNAITAFETSPKPIGVRQSQGVQVVSLDETATQLARRARVARPTAIVLAVLSSLAAAAWLGSLLTAIVRPAHHGETVLIATFAAVAAVALGTVHVRELHARWNSTPAVASWTKPVTRAVLVGLLALGAVELATYALRALLSAEPLGPIPRLLVAGVATGFSIGFERLRRWIG